MEDKKINSSILICLDCLLNETKNLFLTGAQLSFYASKLDYDTFSKFEIAYVGYLEMVSALVDYCLSFREVLIDNN